MVEVEQWSVLQKLHLHAGQGAHTPLHAASCPTLKSLQKRRLATGLTIAEASELHENQSWHCSKLMGEQTVPMGNPQSSPECKPVGLHINNSNLLIHPRNLQSVSKGIQRNHCTIAVELRDPSCCGNRSVNPKLWLCGCCYWLPLLAVDLEVETSKMPQLQMHSCSNNCKDGAHNCNSRQEHATVLCCPPCPSRQFGGFQSLCVCMNKCKTWKDCHCRLLNQISAPTHLCFQNHICSWPGTN